MDFYPIISRVFTPENRPIIALIGGGGKTSLLYKLGQDFAAQNKKVLLTSTVKAGPSPHIPVLFHDSSILIDPFFRTNNPLYLLKKKIREDKFLGFDSKKLKELTQASDICFFEADGARDLSLKAHNDNDPQVPSFATHAIIVVGADAVNIPVNGGKVHRRDLFKSIWGLEDHSILDLPLITRVVTGKRGYLSKLPDGINTIYFINKGDRFPEEAESLAISISQVSSNPVFWGSVQQSWWKTVL